LRSSDSPSTTGPVNDEATLVYRASKHDCDACELKHRCCPNSPARKIPRSIHEAARDRARVIAKTDMALGDKITAEMVDVETMTVSQQAALGHDTYSATSQVVGKVAGGAITKGSVLFVETSFLQPGVVVEGQDLASAIAAGKVAVTMEVDQVNGVGTLVVPGDHVDIILSVWMDQVQISTPGASTNWAVTLPGSSQVTTKMIIRRKKAISVNLIRKPPLRPRKNRRTSPSPCPNKSRFCSL